MTRSYLPGQAELFSRADLVGPALDALADALAAAQEIASRVTLLEARTLVAQQLSSIDAISPLSLERFTALWGRFERFALHGFDVTLVVEVDAQVVRAFLQARTSEGLPPSPATSHLRRTAVRLLFRVLRELRLASGDPTLDMALPTRTRLAVRPLTDEEVDLCRWASLGTLVATRRPAVWALAEAGAATAEIGNVRRADLDLDNGQVWLAGSAKADRRWAPLTDWGTSQLARRVRGLPTQPLSAIAFDGSGDEHSRRTSSAEAITSILRRAGLTGDRDVRPRSVTAWVGCRALKETGRIDEVARRLGLRSLDLAAELVGFDWQAVTDRHPEPRQ